MNSNFRKAPGAPGEIPAWTHAAKTGIGKALNAGSHISFSLSSGAITESYYPREDTPCLGETFFTVTGADGYISDERKDTVHACAVLDKNAPAFKLTNKCRLNKYTITKEVIADPLRNCLLQMVSLTTNDPALRLHCITIPRFPEEAKVKRAYAGSFNGETMLFAETEGMVLAIASSAKFIKRTVGFIGKSDGITQLKNFGHLEDEYDIAEHGNVCLSVEIDISTTQNILFVCAFGHSHQEAGHNALASLLTGFEGAKDSYIAGWKTWHNELWSKTVDTMDYPLLDSSATVLRVSESKLFPGGILASLSVPWGNTRTKDSLGAYHLVWPRDLVLSGGGFAALGDKASLLRVLNYLMTTQLENGCWPQNMWLDGKPHWTRIQLDQVAMPISLVDFCRIHELLSRQDLLRYWNGIKKALKFLHSIGPLSDQDRWEEESGINTFSLATQISAFVAGSNLAGYFDEKDEQEFYLNKADELNDRIDELTYVTDTPLSREHGVPGYYVRLNPGNGPVENIKYQDLDFNKPGTNQKLKVFECIGIDTLALVRFGLRSAHDPKILNTIKIIDSLLKVELNKATCWLRYVGDIYGEDNDGNPYQEGGQNGIGRPWPLLTGERAHYEIAAGNYEYAKHLLTSMNILSDNGFLSEQVWDGEDLPDKKLQKGKPTGSAMPLTWAHSEYIKLCRSLHDKQIFDLPVDVYNRYVDQTIVRNL